MASEPRGWDRACGRAAVAAVLLAASALPGAAWAQGPDTAAAPVRLDEMVVTAAGFEQRRIDAPASITVLPRADLARRRSHGLGELLSGVEGVDAGGRAGKTGGLNVGLRGMPAEYTLVLVDGRRQNAPGDVTPNNFGETANSFLPPLAAIERVEVIRGPMSTLYGSDAMGGVVNVITRRDGDRWTGTVGTDATLQQEDGFGHAWSGSAWAAGPLVPGRLGLSLRGSVRHRDASDLRPTGDAGEGVEISKRGPSPVRADLHTLGARLTLTPAAGHATWLEVDRARQAYDNSRGQLGTLDRPGAFRGYGPELRFHRDQATLAHDWTFGSGSLRASLMRNTTESVGWTIPDGTPGGPPGSGAPDKEPGSPRALRATSTVLDARVVRGTGAHVLSVGAQVWDAEMVDGVALAPFGAAQWALFAEDEWRLAAPLRLTLGLRRDDHDVFGAQVSPRAYLVWRAAPDWTLKGGISRGFRAPRLEQLVDGIIGFGGQGTMALVGTPSLRPETSTTVEVGGHWADAAGRRAGLTLFANRFDDKITRGTPVPNCTYAAAPNRPGCLDYGDFPRQESFRQSVNVDRAATRGAELSAALPLGEAWRVAGNYTYTWSEQQSGENRGMPLTDTPAHMANASVRLHPAGPLSGWLRGEHRSERARRTTAAPDPAYDQLGDYRAYTLLHLGGAYQVARGVTLSATVYNLLNTDFLRYAAYQVEPTAANPSGVLYTNVYNNHQEGRRLWLSTAVSF